MKYIISGFLLLFFVSVTNAQNSNFTDAELNQISESLSSDYIISSQSRDVTGDPYLNPNFTKGKVQISQNVQTGVLFLRLNIEKNIVEFMKGETYFGIQPNKIDGFTLFANPDNLTFKNGFKSDENDINRTTFLRIIYDGKVKLVAHHTTSLKENLATYGSATKKDEYVDHTSFYLIQPSGKFFETKLKRKDILKRLKKNKRDKVLKYANDNNLDFEKEADLIKILEYSDKLTIDM